MVGPEGRLIVKSKECMRCRLSNLTHPLLLTTRHPLIHFRAGVDREYKMFLEKKSAEGCTLDTTRISISSLPFPYPHYPNTA